MKKYLLVSLALLCAATLVWAAEAKEAESLKMGVKGDATLEWGLNRGKGDEAAKHGFNNTTKMTVTVPIVNKGDKVSKGEAPVYAEVSIGEIALKLEGTAEDKGPGDASNKKEFTGDVKDIKAKLHFYGAYLTVYDKPSFKTNYASIWEPINKGKDYNDKFNYEPGFEGFGTKIGYAKKELMDLDVGVKIGSITNMKGETPWKNSTGATIKRDDSKYGIGFDFSMKPVKDLFEFALGVNATLDKGKYYHDNTSSPANGVLSHPDYEEKAIGFGAEIVSKPVKGLELKFGFDGGTASLDKASKKVAFAWDTAFTATYKWVGGGIYAASTGTPFEGMNKDGKSTADLGMYAKFETKGDDPKKVETLLVKGLNAGAYFGVYHLLSDVKTAIGEKYTYPMLMKLYASYQLPLAEGMWIKPYGQFWGESNHDTYSDGTLPANQDPYFGIMYKLGLTFQPVERVEIDTYWQHGKANDNKLTGGMSREHALTTAQKKNHNGEFKLTVKVKF